ncbi:MAG: ankyrin repeat domain-containing protein [Coxiellaceae bacterium]|nr:ankyrin repeat domain-containing protein [Coxiellaceae bacterium]
MLNWAVALNQFELFFRLLADLPKMDDSELQKQLGSVLCTAAEYGRNDIITRLQESTTLWSHLNDLQITAALHHAVISGHQITASLLIELGADSNISRLSCTPNLPRYYLLYLPSIHDVLPINSALKRGDFGMFLMLFQLGSTLSPDQLIHDAVKGSSHRAIQFLLDSGADIDAIDASGQTPLEIACHSSTDYVACYLINQGADCGTQRQLDNLLSDTIKKHLPNTARLLIERGANINADCFFKPLESAVLSKSKTMLDLVLSYPIDINQVIDTFSGFTALMLAARENDTYAVNALLAAGADADIKTPIKKTALDIARLNGHIEIIAALESHTNQTSRCVIC